MLLGIDKRNPRQFENYRGLRVLPPNDNEVNYNMSKAIETKYKGYRFRSRLEARWAVFFDALGIVYCYEEQGYEVRLDGGTVFRWLPDFYLPDYGCHVEVKGGKVEASDSEKMGWLLDYGSPLPYFCDGHDDDYGLLMLGDVPYLKDERHTPAFTFITHHKGLIKNKALIIGKELLVVEECDWQSGGGALKGFFDPSSEQKFVRRGSKYTGGAQLTFDAINKARQARFEHGEVAA